MEKCCSILTGQNCEMILHTNNLVAKIDTRSRMLIVRKGIFCLAYLNCERGSMTNLPRGHHPELEVQSCTREPLDKIESGVRYQFYGPKVMCLVFAVLSVRTGGSSMVETEAS